MAHSPDLGDTTRLATHADCRDQDPRLFDQRSLPEAQDALDICGGCQVVALCDQVVRPGQTYFDGVAAGRIWINGVPHGDVRGRLEPTVRKTCGSEHGYERHRMDNEKACVLCKLAKSNARRIRRAQVKENRDRVNEMGDGTTVTQGRGRSPLPAGPHPVRPDIRIG